MASNKHSRAADSLGDLKHALENYSNTKADSERSENHRSLAFLALAKAFEVCVEYAWKYFKDEVEDRGLDAPSPKDAVRAAAKTKLIDNPELYIRAINARNQSVHDYFSMGEEDFVERIKSFAATLENDL